MKVWIFSFLFFPLLGLAGVKPGIKYQSYVITPTAEANVSFVIVKSIKTDGCNRYGMEARLLPVYSEGPVDTYLLEYSVMQTELGCDPMPPEKIETVKSNMIKINYDHDTMSGVTVLIPRDVRVEFTK